MPFGMAPRHITVRKSRRYRFILSRALSTALGDLHAARASSSTRRPRSRCCSRARRRRCSRRRWCRRRARAADGRPPGTTADAHASLLQVRPLTRTRRCRTRRCRSTRPARSPQSAAASPPPPPPSTVARASARTAHSAATGCRRRRRGSSASRSTAAWSAVSWRRSGVSYM